ncbi:MAG: DUF456 domain-containing protein [Paludibacteraceae bacterium]
MELLVVLGIICVIAGLLGTVLPAIPGVPLSYIGLILLQLSDRVQFSLQFMICWAVITVVVSLLDYYIPIWGTKKFGGSKYGMWGSFIGMIVGLFFGPWGIILGPFVGAVIGEMLSGKKTHHALKAGFGSFVGLIFGNIIKFTAAGFMLFYAVKAII